MEIVSIQFDKSSSPRYQVLADAIERKLEENGCTEETRLPPIRQLSEKLGVSNSTVVAAYRLLEQRGIVYSKPGSGTYVLPKIVTPQHKDKFGSLFQDYEKLKRGKLDCDDTVIDLAGNSPIAETVPVADFKKAIDTVLDTEGGDAFSYLESEGYLPLRQILSRFSRTQYGIQCCPEDILITSGTQQALDLIAKAILNPGDTVLAEMPSYIGMRLAFTMNNARLLGIPVEHDGINLDITEYYARQYKPRLLYTMPVYQTPTGVCMSEKKRKHLLALAEKYDFYIVEDDLFSDLNLRGERLRPLKSDDNVGRVLYLRSFSKLLMPGIRTGYIIAPHTLFEKLAATKYASDISGSSLIQRALTVYFQNDCWNQNLQKLIVACRKRLETALRVVSKWKQFGVQIENIKGGFGLWLTLPEGVTDRKIYNLCRKRKVLLVPGSSFYFSPMVDSEQHLRISFTASNQFEKGLHIVEECIKSAVNCVSNHTIFI